MKLIIDIPEEFYEGIMKNVGGVHQGRLYDIIRDGVPYTWTPATMPPKKNGLFLLRFEAQTIGKGYYSVENEAFGTWHGDDEFIKAAGVVAWMPIPVPKGCSTCEHRGSIDYRDCPDAYTEVAQKCNNYDWSTF